MIRVHRVVNLSKIGRKSFVIIVIRCRNLLPNLNESKILVLTKDVVAGASGRLEIKGANINSAIAENLLKTM